MEILGLIISYDFNNIASYVNLYFACYIGLLLLVFNKCVTETPMKIIITRQLEVDDQIYSTVCDQRLQ